MSYFDTLTLQQQIGEYMNLREYLFRERLTKKAFAKKINYSPVTLSLYVSGKIRLSKRLADIIEKASDGKVTAEEILKDNPSERYKKSIS